MFVLLLCVLACFVPKGSHFSRLSQSVCTYKLSVDACDEHTVLTRPMEKSSSGHKSNESAGKEKKSKNPHKTPKTASNCEMDV